MALAEFKTKWGGYKAGYAEHFNDLCQMLGQPDRKVGLGQLNLPLSPFRRAKFTKNSLPATLGFRLVYKFINFKIIFDYK